jgi:3-hydroxybutyrate dehydrogenase
MHSTKQPKAMKKTQRPATPQRAARRVQRVANAIRPQSTAATTQKKRPTAIGHMGNFLEGRSAIVTGSTSGIGLGVAKALAAHGCNLTLNGFGDSNEITQLQKDISTQYNVKVRYSPADMTQPSQIREMVQGAQKEFGSLDILVNNAGIQHISSVEQFPEEAWDRVMSINLDAVYHATKAAIPEMKKTGYGRIINIASVHGHVASINKSAYVATKHAVLGFTKATALELAGTGVTCTAVCPGWVLTPLVQKQIDLRATQNNQTNAEARISLLSEKQPSKEFVTPEDLGNTIVFLSSPFADQLTGTSVVLDGGWISQ